MKLLVQQTELTRSLFDLSSAGRAKAAHEVCMSWKCA